MIVTWLLRVCYSVGADRVRLRFTLSPCRQETRAFAFHLALQTALHWLFQKSVCAPCGCNNDTLEIREP
jgi:hypothetical protein